MYSENTIAKDRRNHSIDVLKGLAIIFIILTHFDNYGDDSARLRFLFPFWISMAVPIFMVISGYVNSQAYVNHRVESAKDGYELFGLLKKLIKYTIPFCMIFIFEQIIKTIETGTEPSARYLIISFVKGGIGKGSYYYPILIQFVFIFPIIYLLVKKYRAWGVGICGVCNLLYEILQSLIAMDEQTYRLLIFRYLLVISFGCYAAIEKEIKNKLIWLIILFIGISYITSVRYFGITPLFTTKWSGTCLWACMYIAPLIIYIIKNESLRCKALEMIGRSSYNIFLIQMLYYYAFSKYIYSIMENNVLQLLCSLFICIGVGLVFYKLETPLTKYIIRQLMKLKHDIKF